MQLLSWSVCDANNGIYYYCYSLFHYKYSGTSALRPTTYSAQERNESTQITKTKEKEMRNNEVTTYFFLAYLN